MLERVRRCRYCGSDMSGVSSGSYAENPYCQGCLDERLAKAAAEAEKEQGKLIGWRVLENGYVEQVRERPNP